MQMTLPSTFVYEIIASHASDAKNKEATGIGSCGTRYDGRGALAAASRLSGQANPLETYPS